MRELERESPSETSACCRLAIVGAGRLGHAVAAELRRGGLDVAGPWGRGSDGAGAEVVLLCVPDSEIGDAAAAVLPGPAVGHCSGATGLEVLEPHQHRFSLHPLMTVPESGARFTGAGAAVAGSTPATLSLACRLARALDMEPVHIPSQERALYHAAASVASNFLVTLEGAAEQLAAAAGLERAQLVPLVRATVENWAADGAARALTGPIVRGDEDTVAGQRLAVAERAPELLELFDALTVATRRLAETSGQPA